MSTLPDNLPTAPISSVGPGWQAIAVGGALTTWSQYFAFHDHTPSGHPQWVLGTYFTSDGKTNLGAQSYRNPTSLRARLSILLPVARKYLRRWVETYSRHATIAS